MGVFWVHSELRNHVFSDAVRQRVKISDTYIYTDFANSWYVTSTYDT